MNSIIKTDVIVKNEGGNTLTYSDMQELIRKEVSRFYYKYSAIKSEYEIDDIVDEVCLYYFSPMKHFDETRLDHYVKKYNGDINHLKNLFKLTSRQWLNLVLRDKHVKNKEFSLNSIITGVDDKVVEFQDLLVDETIDLEAKLKEEEFLNELLIDLREYNLTHLYNQAQSKNTMLKKLEFICNPYNMIDAHKLTETHLCLIRDIIAGYQSKELKAKYSNYKYLMDSMTEVLSHRYNKVTVKAR